ncbi:hypothetical protein BVRB_2g033970 [Beta vulgaris subsp. vulgaris]|nr:hypothetical protein BVRB_2g033970 [Beta vulgaris subsp. vulgaris]
MYRNSSNRVFVIRINNYSRSIVNTATSYLQEHLNIPSIYFCHTFPIVKKWSINIYSGFILFTCEKEKLTIFSKFICT